MAAPFPYEAVAGAATDPAESEAANLYRQYAWVARLADEMNAETELDLKRTMQFVHHARQFRHWFDALQARVTAGTHTQGQIGDILAGVFGAKRCAWPTRSAMNADFQEIYNAAGTAADWIDANAADYKQGWSINKEVSPGVMTDDPIKVAKPAGVATRIADFRGLFASSQVAIAALRR